MAQRLVRTLCRECRQPFTPSFDDVPHVVPPDFPLQECLDDGTTLYRAVGCRHCRHTGYSGRLGLFELLVADDEVRRLASERASTHLVQQAAVKAGMANLRDNGWRKVCRGITTVDEVLRVTKSD